MNTETKKAMDIRLREIERIIDDAGVAFDGRFRKSTKENALRHAEQYRTYVKAYVHKVSIIKSFIYDDTDTSLATKYYHVFRKLHNTFLHMNEYIKKRVTNKTLTIDLGEVTYIVKYINTIVKYITAQYKY